MMDSMKRAGLEIEAPERAAAVIEVIEKTLGIKIGVTEIIEAAMALSSDDKLLLAQSMCDALGLIVCEPGHRLVLGGLRRWAGDRARDLEHQA
jgi:hypothetical protein